MRLTNLRNRDRVHLVEPGRLHPAVTFTRSTTATYLGPDGLLKTAAANEPRFEYDAAGNYLGLLVEEARTNLFLSSQNLAGPGWGSNATATLASEMFRGFAPFYSVAKTTSTSSESRINLSLQKSIVGTWYTVSVALLAGTSDRVSLGHTAADDGFGIWGRAQDAVATISGPGTMTGSNAFRVITGLSATIPTVVTISRFLNASNLTLGLYIYPDTSISTSIGASIKATRTQMEVGSFATSYIPTTSATVTRSIDSPLGPSAAISYNPLAGTLFAEFAFANGDSSVLPNNRCIASIDNGSTTERIYIYNIAGGIGGLVQTGGVTQAAPLIAGTIPANSPVRAAYAFEKK